MPDLNKKIQQLGSDITENTYYAAQVLTEASANELNKALFPDAPLKKAASHVWGAFSRFTKACSSAFTTASSFVKTAYGAAGTVFNLGKLAKHQYEKQNSLNARALALKQAEYHQEAAVAAERSAKPELAAREKAAASLQRALADSFAKEAELRQGLVGKDAEAIWGNAKYTLENAAETAIDSVYTLASSLNSGAYAVSATWHAGNSLVNNLYSATVTSCQVTNDAFTRALEAVNDYYSQQAVAAATDSLITLPVVYRTVPDSDQPNARQVQNQNLEKRNTL